MTNQLLNHHNFTHWYFKKKKIYNLQFFYSLPDFTSWVLSLSISNNTFYFIFTCREFSICGELFFQLHSIRLSILSLFLLKYYFYYFILTFFSLSSFLFSSSFLHFGDPLPATTTTPPSCKQQTQHPKSTTPKSIKIKTKIKINHSGDPLHHPKPKTTTTPRSANPRPTTTPSKPTPKLAPKPSTQAHAEQTQAISFFLAMENRGREQRREGKKMEEREKKIGQKKKKKKKLK